MQRVLAICFVLLPFIQAYQSQTSQQERYSQLFGQSADSFCDSSKDIRLVLLAQAWLWNPQTNVTDPPVANYTQFVQSLKGTVVFANLETAINGTYAQQNNATITNPVGTHIADPAVIDILTQSLGVNAFGIANNHFTDFSPAGTISGLMELNNRGLKYTGAGKDLADAMQPTYVSHQNGKKIGITALVTTQPTWDVAATDTTPGCNSVFMAGLNTSGTGVFVPNSTQQQWQYQQITQVCQKNDLVLTYHHNHAFNDTWAIDPWWQSMAHSMIDAGSSIYLSNGAQNIRGIEIYNGAIIAYSNGNLFFESTGLTSVMNQEGYILDVCFSGSTTKFIAARVIPTILQNGTGTKLSDIWNASHGTPTLSSGAQAMETLQKLQNLSMPFGTNITIDSTLNIGYITVSGFVPPASSLNCLRNTDLATHSGANKLALGVGFWLLLSFIAVLI